MHVVIVGAGIVGLSTAYALRKRGVAVTVVERGTIPYEHASSSDHHRMIRPFYGNSVGYTARMPAAYAAWDQMWADLPRPVTHYYANTGIIGVSRAKDDDTDQSRIAMDVAGQSYEQIDDEAAIAAAFPHLETDGISYVLRGEGGALMANRIMADLADWLRADGAILRELSVVDGINTTTGTVTLTAGEKITGDTVVVCAGVETTALFPDLAQTLKPHRSLVLYASPPADLAEIWANAPCWNDLGNGTSLWGIAPVHGLPLKLGNGDLGGDEDTDGRRTATSDDINAMLASYVGYFKGADRFTPLWAQANYWTLAPGSAFFLEQRDRVLISSACSGHGFKFGALSGQDLADAVTQGAPMKKIADRMAARDVA